MAGPELHVHIQARREIQVQRGSLRLAPEMGRMRIYMTRIEPDDACGGMACAHVSAVLISFHCGLYFEQAYKSILCRKRRPNKIEYMCKPSVISEK